MKIKKELIKREIAGDCILVPVGKSTLESNGLFALNELGAFIWDILPGAETEEEIVTAVLKEYEIDQGNRRTGYFGISAEAGEHGNYLRQHRRLTPAP